MSEDMAQSAGKERSLAKACSAGLDCLGAPLGSPGGEHPVNVGSPASGRLRSNASALARAGKP